MLRFWLSLSKGSKKRQNFNSRLLLIKVEVQLALFWINKDFFRCFLVCTSSKFNKIGLNQLTLGNFCWKMHNLKFLAKFLAKKFNENSQQNFVGSQKKSTVLFLTICTYFTNIDEILDEKVNKNWSNINKSV